MRSRRKNNQTVSKTAEKGNEERRGEEDDSYASYETGSVHTVYLQMFVEAALTIPPLIASFCYINSVNGHLFFDDKYAIHRNTDVTNWNSPVSDIFKHDYWGRDISDPASHKSYRPLVTLLFKLNHFFHGLRPIGYHATNIVFHVLNTGLVTMVSKRIFAHIEAPGIDVEGASFMAALMFAVHPIHTEAVSSVVGRAEVMCCMFFLLSFYNGIRAAQPHHTNMKDCIMAQVHMMLATLCKEQGITVIGVIMVYDLFCILLPLNKQVNPNIEFNAFNQRDTKKVKNDSGETTVRDSTISERIVPFLQRNVLYLFTSFNFLYWRIKLNQGTLPTWPLLDNPAASGTDFYAKLLNYPYIYAYNAWLLLFPMQLCGDYTYNSIAQIESMYDFRNALTILFVLSCAALVLYGVGYWRRTTGKGEEDVDDTGTEDDKHNHKRLKKKNRDSKNKTSAAAAATNPVSTSTTASTASSTSSTGSSSSSSSTTTTTSSGNAKTDSNRNVGVGLGIRYDGRNIATLFVPTLYLRRDILIAIALIVLPFLPASNLFFPVGFLIAERVLYIPSLGQALLFGSLCARSWNFYKKPYMKYIFWTVCVSFALRTSLRNRDWRTEETFWRSVIDVNPTNAKAHFNYGNVMFSQGRISESVIYFKESLKVVPDDPTTLVNMATSLYRLNKQNQAIVHYERASKYAQGFGQYFNWGYIHELRNEYDRAIQIFDMASQFMPEGGRMALYQDDPYAKAVCAIHLGTLLCRQHLSDQGLLAFYRAVAIDPSHQEAWMRMGLEHAVREGEKPKALYCLDRAARIDPSSREQIQQYLTQQGNIKEAARYSPSAPLPTQYPLDGIEDRWDPEILGKQSMRGYISETMSQKSSNRFGANNQNHRRKNPSSMGGIGNMGFKNGDSGGSGGRGGSGGTGGMNGDDETNDIGKRGSPSLKRGKNRKRKKKKRKKTRKKRKVDTNKGMSSDGSTFGSPGDDHRKPPPPKAPPRKDQKYKDDDW